MKDDTEKQKIVIGGMILLALLALFSLFVTVAKGQSMSILDYKFVYRDKTNRAWYIEKAPVQTLKNGNKVFWALTFYDENIIQLSEEVNCKTGRARINGSIVHYMDNNWVYNMVPVRAKTGWMPRTDEVGNALVREVCGRKKNVHKSK